MLSNAASASTLPGWDFLLTPAGAAATKTAHALLAKGSSPLAVNQLLRQGSAGVFRGGSDSAAIAGATVEQNAAAAGASGEQNAVKVLTGEQSAAALKQAELRIRAEAKFGPLASELLFTPAGLEQATRWQVADLHAARFAGAGTQRVADLGCGIGAESLALQRAGLTPLAVEIDPLTAAYAEHNLRQQPLCSPDSASSPEVACAAAEDFNPRDADAVFFDPARRTSGHRDTRRVSPDDYSPSLEFVWQIANQLPTGVKLGPGFPHELIPAGAEAQWISVNGQAVELSLWFGALRRPGIGRSAVVFQGEQKSELTAETAIGGDPDDPLANPPVTALTDPAELIGMTLYEPDPTVIRARLIGAAAKPLAGALVDPQIAYFVSPEARKTPFAAGFKVFAACPFKSKAIGQLLREFAVGKLEIKKRGVDVVPEQLRRSLKLRGSRQATLIITRFRGGRIALLADRI